jgi:hypothetical protein
MTVDIKYPSIMGHCSEKWSRALSRQSEETVTHLHIDCSYSKLHKIGFTQNDFSLKINSCSFLITHSLETECYKMTTSPCFSAVPESNQWLFTKHTVKLRDLFNKSNATL